VGPVQDCPQCTEARAEANHQANGTPDTDSDSGIPERLQPIFASVPLFQNAARRAERLANQFQEIERTPAYVKAVEGTQHKQYSTYIRSAGRKMAAITPKRPCPECKGEYEPSLETDPCKICGGRGYQTAEEVEEQ
jgi:hypothetical protein